MKVNLKIWRQKDARSKGGFVTYTDVETTPDTSFLETLDILNERLIEEGQEPVVFDHDCREGICGLIGHMNTPEAYTATKGAITLLTKSVAARYGKDNIRCNSIHPATVDTPFVAALMADPVKKQARLNEIPLGRLTSVEDVANAVLYLASDEASFLNGVNLPIDGGVTCY